MLKGFCNNHYIFFKNQTVVYHSINTHCLNVSHDHGDLCKKISVMQNVHSITS